MDLCFATNNRNKLEEVSRLIGSEFRIISLKEIGCSEEIPEIFPTISENSYAKAYYIFRKFHRDVFADDTGLEVEVLGGEPGVHSARYAGPGKDSNDNIRLLLNKLGDNSNRSARFKTVITLILNGKSYQFEGIINGNITKKKKGENGFGYDPVFLPEGYEVTFAEMTSEEKNRISHRAIAINKLALFLNSGKVS